MRQIWLEAPRMDGRDARRQQGPFVAREATPQGRLLVVTSMDVARRIRDHGRDFWCVDENHILGEVTADAP